MAAAADKGSGAKEKKPRPPPPAPPPALGTAALVIRAAAARVFGLRPGRCSAELQPVWVTEPGCSKLTLNLDGCARKPFPKDEQHSFLIDALEKEANRLAKTDVPITILELGRKKAEAEYGEAMYDESGAKSSDQLRLAYLPGAIFAEIPANWSLCKTAGACGNIRFLVKEVPADSKKKPDTMILGKTKKLIVKYEVDLKDAAAAQDGGSKPEASDVRELDVATVRVEVRGVDVDVAESRAAAAAAPAAAATFVCRACEGTGKVMGMTCPLCDGEVAEAAAADDDMVVDPWSVKGKIDYNKLIKQFGSTPIDQVLLARIEKLTVGKGRVPALHRWLRRGIFFSHRELDAICRLREEGKPFYLYTGRGPNSAAMHLGHLLPFMFTQWLQKAFDVPLVVQMTDDEKFLWKGEYDSQTGDNLDKFRQLTIENAKDIIACGFDKKKTFIFSDCDYVGHMYPNIVRIWKAITYSTARGAFGFVGESNIGQSAFPAIQAAPSFPSSFHVPLRGDDKMACLIPCAIDQDPYFRVTRDIAHKLVPHDHPLKGKPSLIHCKFFPPLQGAQGKMSSSDENSAVFLTDSDEMIERKIKEYAFSGGRQTAKEQREQGADLDVDVPFKWLQFFLEDDEELAQIEKEYGSGTGKYWSTGEVKARLVQELKDIVKIHQKDRAKIDLKEVQSWMSVRELEF
jgi:tryptophanyl-tRNA synthetase